MSASTDPAAATAPAVPRRPERRGVAAAAPIRLPAAFRFECYGISFEAEVAASEGGGAQLTVCGRLGTVPYSAESPAARRHMHAIVDAGKDLPFADLSLTSSQKVIARGTMGFSDIPSPASVAAGTSVIAVAMKPVVELIAACREMAKTRRA